MKNKQVIYAFPQPKWIDKVSCDGKPCGGAGGCGSSHTSGGNCKSEACGDGGCDMTTMLTGFGNKHPDEVEIKIADYSTLDSIKNSLKDLNEILAVNGEDLRVSFDNLELVFSQIAPIIAIDGVLAFVGKIPGEDELLAALELIPA